MKKILLSSLITLSLLTGCDDADKAKAQQESSKPAQVAQVAKKTVKAPKGEQQATEAEARYRDLISKSYEHLNLLLGNSELFTVKVLNIEYNKAATESQAKTSVELQFSNLLENKKLIINSEDKIIHTDELADKGILAQVIKTYKVDTEKSDKDLSLIAPALNYLEEIIDLEANGINTTETKIKAFEFQENNFKAKYEGFVAKSKYEQKDLLNPLITINSDFNFNKLEVGDNKFNLSVEPIVGKYNTGKTRNLETSPISIKVDNGDGNVEVKIGKVNYQAKNLDFDKDLAIFFGDSSVLIKDIVVLGKSNYINVPVGFNIDNVKANSSLINKGNLIDLKGDFSIEPITDFLNMFLKTPAELKINKISLDYTIPNITKELLALGQKLQSKNPLEAEKYFKDNEEKVREIAISAIKSNNLVSNLGLRIDLASGYAEAKLATKSKGQVEIDLNNLNKTFYDLAEKVELRGDIAISDAILDASGLKEVFEIKMAAFKPKLENGIYKFQIEFKDKSLFINGIKLSESNALF